MTPYYVSHVLSVHSTLSNLLFISMVKKTTLPWQFIGAIQRHAQLRAMQIPLLLWMLFQYAVHDAGFSIPQLSLQFAAKHCIPESYSKTHTCWMKAQCSLWIFKGHNLSTLQGSGLPIITVDQLPTVWIWAPREMSWIFPVNSTFSLWWWK